MAATSFAAMDSILADSYMSTTMFSNLGNTFASKDVIHSGVKGGRQKFAEYVRSQMLKGDREWSTYEVERRAQAKGYEISKTTVSNILNCKVRDVSEDKLNALAAAFEVPLSEVFAAYRGTVDEEENSIRNERLAALAADAEKLTPDNQQKFEALMEYVQHTVRQMIKEQGNGLPRVKGRAAKNRVG